VPRRAVLSEGQRAALIALPTEESFLVRHWTLSEDDLAIIVSRRRPHNRLGFAVQLCALRYPGRLLRPGELVPTASLAFVAEQIEVSPEALAEYATRGPTRYEQLDTLRNVFGFSTLTHPTRDALQEWLLPVALTTTGGAELARMLLDEFRRRGIIVPGISQVERMVARSLLDAERHVSDLLTATLSAEQKRLLDALLVPRDGTTLSGLSWLRQPARAPGRRSFAFILERLAVLRAIDLDPAMQDRVHPERLRRLHQEGYRLTAQHLQTLQPARRRAILVAIVLEVSVTLTDDAVLMFDKLIGRMFRREQNSEETALKRDRRTINGKIRLLARLGDALLAARNTGDDMAATVEATIGWDSLAREVDEARKLVRSDTIDPVAMAAAHHPVLRHVGPAFVASFTFGAVPACRSLASAVDLMRTVQSGRSRKLPADAPTGFVRRGWRHAVRKGEVDRRTWEFLVLVELRDRLRAGDMWIEGSRRYRAVEQQLIPAPVFAAMREAGPLPIPAQTSAETWLAERRTHLGTRLAQVREKARTDALDDVVLTAGKLRISPLKAITPEIAETALAPLYAHLPSIRITDLLAEVDRWTGFSDCFTHLRSGKVADDPRAILTAVLADATNLGHTRMAEACTLVTRRQLGWLSSWHLREDTYGHALARLVDRCAPHPARHALERVLRIRSVIQFGRSELSTRTSRAGDRSSQSAQGLRARRLLLHPCLGPLCPVPFEGHIGFRRRGRASAGRSAPSRSGPAHRGASRRRGRRLRSRLRAVPSAGLSVRAPCRAQRIPNIGARRLHLFDGMVPGPDIEPLVAARIDERLIAAHWDDVLRLATSIRTGTVSASIMLERLGSYPRANGLALALREIGRVERCTPHAPCSLSTGSRNRSSAAVPRAN